MFADDYFGLCPRCHWTDGYINLGCDQWFYCRRHRTKWCSGSNLLDSWRFETKAEQRAEYEAMDFGSYERVESFFYPRIVTRIHYVYLRIVARLRNFVHVAVSRVGRRDEQTPL